MKLSVKTLIELHAALAALDGRFQIVKDSLTHTDKVMMVPYKFKSGKTRWRIAKNLNICKQHNEDFTKSRDSLIMEISEGIGVINEADKVKIQELNIKVQQILDTSLEVNGLLNLSEDELDTEANDFPGTVLATLMPLIDVSQSGS